ncbi:MAG: TolC family protein [Candidatus Eisenbacteria bacterium]|uniref:TolC family protein n=1 Tax=Eiseniibacteriota bacterium TaxID=2212470 RepID=A0A948RWV3_UNCEI|nr:TolC family protein [Candidatus Eisenbacteria bacterium]MBU1950751.1 TolC family protein [Candidatus Eisenbacteria bacterium]MBU2691022.1 TolC family protein [Candidatus Eisenbacteria bacterium]
MEKPINIIPVLLALCLGSATGWADSSKEPVPRALGQRFSTYTAPADPPQGPDAQPAGVEPEGILTLETALEFALLYNPELTARAWEIRAAEARKEQVGLWSNPEIGLEVEGFDGSGDLAGVDAAELGIRLEHKLEISGARSKREHVASLERDLAFWDFETARLDLITGVTQRFMQTVAAQKRLSLADDILGLDEAIFATVQERVDAGKDPPVESAKAHVTLSTARINRMGAERDLEIAQQILAESWGGLSPRFEKVAGEFETVTEPPPFDELVALLEQNLEFSRWTTETGRYRAMVDLESRNGIPAPSIFGGYKHFQANDEHAYLFGISIPLPLFDRNQGAVREAKYNLAQAGVRRRMVETKIRAELTTAYQGLFWAYSTVGILESEILPSAQDAFDTALGGYRNGKFQYLIVLDAQRTLFEARGSYINALEAYHNSRAGLERLIGVELGSVAGMVE